MDRGDIFTLGDTQWTHTGEMRKRFDQTQMHHQLVHLDRGHPIFCWMAEDALVTKPVVPADDDGWIENAAGVWPGPVSAVKLRNGYIETANTIGLRWNIESTPGDITHFKPAAPSHLTITLTGPQASGKTRVGEYIKAILGSYGARVTDDDGPFCYHTPPLDVIRGCQITVTSS